MLASLSLNAVLLHRQYAKPWDLTKNLPSRYAHLRRNLPLVYVAHTDHDSTNRTIQDAAWSDRDLESWHGMVALDDNHAASLDLPHSQRWPWDQFKGVYILTGAHELHCLRALREYTNENYDGTPAAQQTWTYPHILHCLNILRQSVMCSADDTPLYIGRLHANINVTQPSAGAGFARMCRDWSAMMAWARNHSACYVSHYVHGTENLTEVERYKYCPDGSKPWLENHQQKDIDSRT